MNEPKGEKWIFTFGTGQPNQGMYVVMQGTFAETRQQMFDCSVSDGRFSILSKNGRNGWSGARRWDTRLKHRWR